MSHAAGAFTGIIRDAHALVADAQDMVGGEYRANLRRTQATGNLSALTSGVMLSTALYLVEGDTVNELTFLSATTAAGTPTNYWFALYSPDGALLGQTEDQGSAAWAANTAKTLELQDPVTVSESGTYYAAVMVAATTPPTLVGVTVHTGVSQMSLGGGGPISRTSGSGLTTTAPATVASPTASTHVPFVAAT